MTTVIAILFVANIVLAAAKGALDQLAVKYAGLSGVAGIVGTISGFLSKIVGLVSANTTTPAAVAKADAVNAQKSVEAPKA